MDDITAWFAGSDPAALARLTPAERAVLDTNAIGGSLGVIGSGMSVASHLMFGQQAQAGEQFQAAQLRQNATQTLAAGTRQAFDVLRHSEILSSKALAAAAASGGGATDPTVVTVMSRLAAEGAYRAASALYTAEDRKQLLETQADAKEYQGKVTRNNARMVAGAQLVKGATSLMSARARGQSLFERYGAGLDSESA